MHALIIEDQFVIATAIEDELRDLGYTSFDLVDREEDAIEAAERMCPDLITADQRLADGTGVQAVRVICDRRPIPVVFISDHPEDVRNLVPDAVIVPKPFTRRILRDAIGQAIVTIRADSLKDSIP